MTSRFDSRIDGERIRETDRQTERQIYTDRQTHRLRERFFQTEGRIKPEHDKAEKRKIVQLGQEGLMSQSLLGLCCSIETRDRVEIIIITAVLFD